MINFETFTEKDIPYGTLANFGLTQEMIDDLPGNIMTKLLGSRWTPRLPIMMTNGQGEKYLAQARIRLIRRNNGSVDVIFAPYCGSDKLNSFTMEQQEMLKQGKAIIADVKESADEAPHRCYVQFDPKLNQTMHVPVEIIMQNLSYFAEQCELDDTDRDFIANGEVATVIDGENPVSIGIDLNDAAAIRITPGTVDDWKLEADSDMVGRCSVGMYGCWITNDYGEMRYYLEKDYTDEIRQEISRTGLQNSARAQGLHL